MGLVGNTTAETNMEQIRFSRGHPPRDKAIPLGRVQIGDATCDVNPLEQGASGDGPGSASAHCSGPKHPRRSMWRIMERSRVMLALSTTYVTHKAAVEHKMFNEMMS